MVGFHDSDQRGTHSANPQILGGSLQRRPPTLQSWARNTGSEFTEGRGSGPTALHSERLPSCCNFHSRWSAYTNKGWKELLHGKRSKRSESLFGGAQGHALGILREAANISGYRVKVSFSRLIHVVLVGY